MRSFTFDVLIRTSASGMLFSDDTPFKPKVVNRKDTYKRKPKHGKGYDYE